MKTDKAYYKELLRKGEWQVDNLKIIKRVQTTGSTGEPFTFNLTKRDLKARETALVWLRNEINVYWFTPRLIFWRSKKKTIGQKVLSALGLVQIIPVVSAKEVVDLSSVFQRAADCGNSALLRGYARTILLYAKWCMDKGINISYSKIVLSGENISSEEQRFIKDVFSSRSVYNVYGSTEFPSLAYKEIDEKHFKINPSYIIERGEQDEILVTTVGSWSHPFRKYSTGDIGQFDTSGQLVKVNGRLIENFILPTGNIIVNHIWMNLFRKYEKVNFYVINYSCKKQHFHITIWGILEKPLEVELNELAKMYKSSVDFTEIDGLPELEKKYKQYVQVDYC